MDKNETLRVKLASPRLMHAMGAHNPLSAKLAERAGFDAIWGSGFELSASYALPDASLLPMSMHLEMTRAIASAVGIPLIADIDTGFGNAINVSYAIPQFEAAGASAVVMEDKTFPKDTSLREGARQELVRVEEFQGKIAAACAARRDANFAVIARVEALIAGRSQNEAQRRGLAYAEAGADAILIHSRQRSPQEIFEFVRFWEGSVPLVLIPTTYPDLTEAHITEMKKVCLVIYANHAIRAAMGAMLSVFTQIRRDGGIANVDATLPSVKSILELQGDARMRELEGKYLK